MRLLFLGLLACVATAATANEENDVYFESSGDEETDVRTKLITDDEDLGYEASGEPDEVTTMQAHIVPSHGGDDRPRVKDPTVSQRTPDKEVDHEDNGTNEEASESSASESASSQFLAAVIVGGCIGLLFAICVIMLLVYRMRKKDEGSYALEYGLDKKPPQGNYEYTKGVDSKEYFA